MDTIPTLRVLRGRNCRLAGALTIRIRDRFRLSTRGMPGLQTLVLNKFIPVLAPVRVVVRPIVAADPFIFFPLSEIVRATCIFGTA